MSLKKKKRQAYVKVNFVLSHGESRWCRKKILQSTQKTDTQPKYSYLHGYFPLISLNITLMPAMTTLTQPFHHIVGKSAPHNVIITKTKTHRYQNDNKTNNHARAVKAAAFMLHMINRPNIRKYKSEYIKPQSHFLYRRDCAVTKQRV